ncbi:MAG: VWA domain-containing protein [Bryobacteraceae bacterium]
MKSRPLRAGLKLMRRGELPGLLLICGALAMAQLLPPGQVPTKPPQPGELGSGPPKGQSENSSQSSGQQTPDAAATADIPTIGSVKVRYVLVPTTVVDKDNGDYINGLTAADFQLLDNDKPQRIESDVTQQPLSLVLVIQANSEVEPMLPKIKRTGLLLQGLVTGEGGDVAVLAFDHRMQLIQDFTKDADKLDDAMQKITAGSSTAALIDAVMKADHMLKDHDPQNIRRRVVLVLSRNLDKGSETHLQEAVHAMQFDNVIVYCVDMSKSLTALLKKPDYPRPQNGGVPPEALPNLRGNGAYSETDVVKQENGNVLNGVPPMYRSIRDLFKKTPAEAFTYFTGGKVYSFAAEKGLEAAITDIGKELNSQYLLSYNPNDKNEPGFHTIKVVINRPRLDIRTRPGYWWGGGQQ